MSEFNLSYLDYPLDLGPYYKKLCHLPGFVLLESGDKARGRYDILSAYPYDRLKIARDSLLTADAHPLLQSKIIPRMSEVDLPFQGGAIGFFSYDFACALAGIAMSPQAELAQIALMDVGLYDWALIIDHELKKITVFSANTQTITSTVVSEVIARWQKPDATDCGTIHVSQFTPLMSKSTYQDAFYAIQADLRQGRCYQVNLTQPFKAAYEGDSWAVYEKIKHGNPVPFAAFLRSDHADILCFSPERFVKMSDRAIATSPIKGTSSRALNEEEDKALRQALQQSVKNRAENVMIVDLLRNDLGKIAVPGSVQVSVLCALESYESVHHLVSHISAVCREDVTPIDAFSACFPGGSITGAPKHEAMKVIAEQEPYARGVYCGNIGYFSNHGSFDSNIAIRTLVATSETLHLAAGGAIVMDSTWEEEYQECFTKIDAILKGVA